MLADRINIGSKSLISCIFGRQNAFEHWNLLFTLVLYSAFSTGLNGTLKPSTAESQGTLGANQDDFQMDKKILDDILQKHKAQPVGDGYIDIIVSRDNYKDFVSDLVTHGFKIKSVSWWEWCADKKENEYGLGGPESIFYKGWFSEIPVDVDDFNFSADTTQQSVIREIIKKIETKTISFSNENVTFNQSNWLTPAIWLDVPDYWRN